MKYGFLVLELLFAAALVYVVWRNSHWSVALAITLLFVIVEINNKTKTKRR